MSLFMNSFLRMEVEQDDESIYLYLNTYIQEILQEYNSSIKKLEVQ